MHVQASATLPAHLPPPPFSSSVRAHPCSLPCLPRLPPPANDSLAAGVGEEERESRREGAMKNLSPPPSSSSSAQSISTQGLICYCKRKYLHIKSQMCAKLPTTSGDAHLGADDVLDVAPYPRYLRWCCRRPSRAPPPPCILGTHLSQIRVGAHPGLKRDGGSKG